MSARHQLIGMRAELKQKLLNLVLAIRSHADALAGLLSTRVISSGVETLDADTILYNAQQLHRLKQEHAMVQADIERISEELGD